ncbi:hypothetical protein KEG38_37355 [Polyangium jinanense]|uniref:hypothetical protein n=1 Tax=Polyangium jinanense TaxID=2829994 RepID=UPI00234010ED|nr:hypothetical protein [Polyangium jinanense]MDC3959582.1 hypothetical protein [Polyangium jinanense]
MRRNLLPLPLAFALVSLASPAARGGEPPGWVPSETAEDLPPPPPAPPPPRPGPTTYTIEQRELSEGPTKMASPPAFYVGTILAGVGLLGIVTGLVIRADLPETECTNCPAEEKRSASLGLLIGGGLGMLIGIPIAAVGGRKVPDEPSWARPKVFISPRGGALQWTF